MTEKGRQGVGWDETQKGREIRACKKLEFQLAYGSSSSPILFALGKSQFAVLMLYMADDFSGLLLI